MHFAAFFLGVKNSSIADPVFRACGNWRQSGVTPPHLANFRRTLREEESSSDRCKGI